ncbi:MAG: hypothetical protein WC978_03285 [bacterium]
MDFGHPAAIFVSSFIIGLSGAMMKGPLLAVTIRHASIRGFSAAPLLVLGLRPVPVLRRLRAKPGASVVGTTHRLRKRCDYVLS